MTTYSEIEHSSEELLKKKRWTSGRILGWTFGKKIRGNFWKKNSVKILIIKFPRNWETFILDAFLEELMNESLSKFLEIISITIIGEWRKFKFKMVTKLKKKPELLEEFANYTFWKNFWKRFWRNLKKRFWRNAFIYDRINR